MDKWKQNLIPLIGLFLIITGISIYILDFLHAPATNILYPLLLGTSEGKAILLFIFMGSLLILNCIIASGKISSRFANMDISDSRRFLKYALILILITYVVGIFIEIWLRLKYGVSLFTVFVSLNPEVSTTSIIHSHIYKSALGSLSSNLGAYIPSNINTGDSLFKFISPMAYLIVITLPLTYMASLISMDNRMGHYKMIIAFAASLSMIGMIDGGLFSNPAIIGFAGIIGMYYIKRPFSPRNLIKPSLIVLIIILVGLSLEIAGSGSDEKQITLIHQREPIDWSGYDVRILNNTILIKTDQDDKNSLLKLFNTLPGKADAFFINWNFYSYF